MGPGNETDRIGVPGGRCFGRRSLGQLRPFHVERPVGVNSLTDTELREDPVEQVLGVYGARDAAQGAGGQTEVL
jgi:hypothetical protein